MNPPPTFESQLLTPQRLMWVFDIGESTEAQWREEKAVSFFRRGRIVRYTPEAVLELIARNTVRSRLAPAGAVAGTQCLDWQRIERLIADQVNARFEFGNQEGRKAA